MSRLQTYKASAGAGKTHQLTGIYLGLLIRNPGNHKKILAITFTRKAAAEMSERVLNSLVTLVKNPLASPYLNDLLHLVNGSMDELHQRASKALDNFLFDQGHVSISTIDAFSQKLLRAFARESGLSAAYQIELDHSGVIEKAAQALVLESVHVDEWANWLTEWVDSRLEEGKSGLRIFDEITKMGSELLKEQILYRMLDPNYLAASLEDVRNLHLLCRRIIQDYHQGFVRVSREVNLILEQNRLTVNNFNYSGNSPLLHMISPDHKHEIKSREVTWSKDPEAWLGKKVPEPFRTNTLVIVEQHLLPLLQQYLKHIEENGPNHRAAKAVSNQLFSLGISTLLVELIMKHMADNEIFLIGFTNPFLYNITSGNPASFLYEKTGSFFKHFLIDEFQDTSELQWKNLKPLLENSLSVGGTSLVVGDVKQSIYRWRNSDWRLLHQKAADDLKAFGQDIYPMNENFRSADAVRDFNNLIFSGLPPKIDQILQTSDDEAEDEGEMRIGSVPHINQVYSDVQQNPGRKLPGGFVRFRFTDADLAANYNDFLSSEIPSLIEDLQLKRGFKPSDIVFLVRKNHQARQIISMVGDYLRSNPGVEGVNYSFSSADSLRIGSASSIRLIVQAMRYINQTDEPFHEKMLRNEYRIFIEEFKLLADIDLPDQSIVFCKLDQTLRTLPLRQLFGELLSVFSLNGFLAELDFLMHFEECLGTYLSNGQDDLNSFLTWWDQTGARQSVKALSSSDAMQIMTVHKAKGLQFPVVIFPYANANLRTGSGVEQIIWADTTNTLFNGVPMVPIKVASALMGTCFEQAVSEEKYSNALDELNVFYVACTRAEKALFLFGTRGGGRIKNTLSNLVHDLIIDQIDPSGSYSAGDAAFLNESNNLPEESVVSLSNMNHYLDMKSLPISSGFESGQVRLGILMHRILAGLNSFSELKGLDVNYIKQFGADDDVALLALQKLRQLTDHALIQQWMSRSYQTINEKPLLLPDGELRVPDRVMLGENETIVIDFKSGLPRRSDERQVNEYIHLIGEMGYQNVQGYLVYLSTPEVVRVTD